MKRLALILALGGLTMSALQCMESLPQDRNPQPAIQQAPHREQPQGDLTRAQFYLNNLRHYVRLGSFLMQVGSSILEETNAEGIGLTDEQVITQRIIRAFIEAFKLENVILKIKDRQFPLHTIVNIDLFKRFLQTINTDYFNPDLDMAEKSEEYMQFLRRIVNMDQLQAILALAGENVKVEKLITPGSLLGYLIAPCAAIADRDAISKLMDDLLAGKQLGKSRFVDCFYFGRLLQAEGIDLAEIPVYDSGLLGLVSFIIDLQRNSGTACSQLLRTLSLYDAHERTEQQEQLARRAAVISPLGNPNNDNNAPKPAVQNGVQHPWYSGITSWFSIGTAEPAGKPKANGQNGVPAHADNDNNAPAPAVEDEAARVNPQISLKAFYTKLNTVLNIGQFFFQLGSILAQYEDQDLSNDLLNQGILNSLIRSIRWGNITVTIAGHTGKVQDFCKIEQLKLLLQAINDDYFAQEPRENSMAVYIRAFKEALNQRALIARMGQDNYNRFIAKLDAALAYAAQGAPVMHHIDIESFFSYIGYTLGNFCNVESFKMLLDKLIKREPLSKTMAIDCFKFKPLLRALGYAGDEAALELLDHTLHSFLSFAYDLKQDRATAEQRMITCLALYDFEQRAAQAVQELTEAQRNRLVGQLTVATAINGQAARALEGMNLPRLRALAVMGARLAPQNNQQNNQNPNNNNQ